MLTQQLGIFYTWLDKNQQSVRCLKSYPSFKNTPK